MSVENKHVVDVIGIDKNENVILTISDHLEWDEFNEHLIILQDKLNSYLGFIESGNLYESYPDAIGRHIVINVCLKYKPNKVGKEFLARSEKILTAAGYGFSFKHLDI